MNPFALPVHPILVHVPLAMLAVAWGCMILGYVTGRKVWHERARLFEIVGVASLPLVIIAGFVDTRGFRFVGDWRWDQPLLPHTAVALVGSAIFGGHFLWRHRRPSLATVRHAAIDVAWVTLGLWAFVLAGAIAGEMVYGA